MVWDGEMTGARKMKGRAHIVSLHDARLSGRLGMNEDLLKGRLRGVCSITSTVAAMQGMQGLD